jgi:hypothetical protein
MPLLIAIMSFFNQRTTFVATKSIRLVVASDVICVIIVHLVVSYETT